MEIDEALAIVDTKLTPKQLNDLQEFVLRESWENKTYQEIAINAGYDYDYIRVVGFGLWQTLSNAFAEKVTKKNFRSVLRKYACSKDAQVIKTSTVSLTPAKPQLVELPKGAVSLDSPFYIKRPPLEEQCYCEILKPGGMVRLCGSKGKGKTSLKNRILTYATTQGYHTVSLNFYQAELLHDLNGLLRWFCANVTQQLKLEPRLDDYWDEDLGSKMSCTIYFEAYILPKIESGLVLAFDELHRLFEYVCVAQNFLPLLRFWYEKGKDEQIWQKLKLVVVHSTEIYVPLNINQSPFNVGLSLKLPEFTEAQVQDLALRHGLVWEGLKEVQQLMAMVGGHPYLVRLALYHLATDKLSLEQLLQAAPTLTGIYSDHLREKLIILKQNPELMTAMQMVVNNENGVKLEPILAYKLQSICLIKLHGDLAMVSYELYRLYFLSQL